MARRLVIVESVSPLAAFVCQGHGLGDRPHLLLKPGMTPEPGEVFRPGDGLVLKRPDGSILITQIAGCLEVGYNRTRHGGWVWDENCIAVPELNRNDVPPGTEVWSVDSP